LINFSLIEKYLISFLQEETYKINFNGGILGLSGGIDSAVVAVLAHRVFGDYLLCVKMPSHYSSQNSLDDADALCRDFAMRSEIASIEPMLSAYEEINPNLDNLRKGNFSFI